MHNERRRQNEKERGGEGEKARPEARVARVYTRASGPGGNFKHLRPSNTRIIYDTRAPIKQSLNSFVYAGEARHVAALIYGRTSAVRGRNIITYLG